MIILPLQTKLITDPYNGDFKKPLFSSKEDISFYYMAFPPC